MTNKKFRRRAGGWIVLLVSAALLMTACGSKPAKQTYQPAPTNAQQEETQAQSQTISQTEAVALLEELFALPEETAAEIETSESAKMLSLINEKTVCNIESIHADSIELSITAPDMRTLFLEQTDENADNTDPVAESARILEAVLARLEAEDCPLVTNKVTAALDHSSGSAQIVMSEELADAIYGNMLTLFDELMSSREEQQ